MIVVAGGMGERRDGPAAAVVDWERGGCGAVCSDRNQAGWARMGRIQELILCRALFLFKG